MLGFAEAGQMGVDDGGQWAFVAKVDLDLPEVFALLQQVRGIGVSQRLPILLMSSRRGRSITGIIRFADVRSK